MNQELPKYHETFIPVLKVLESAGPLHYNELRKRVRDEFYGDLPPELLDLKTKGGDQLVLNRIGWAKAYLKQAEMVSQPARAIVQITDKGKEVLKRGTLTLQDLTSDSDFLKNRKAAGSAKLWDSETTTIDDTNSPQDLIDFGIRAIESNVKSDLLARLKSTDPYDFEKVVLKLFEKMGYGETKVTPKSGDGGIDGIISQDSLGFEKIYVQAKKYKDSKVRETEIRDFIGAMSRDTNKGIFVTTSVFDDKAKEKAKDATQKIILIDGEMLADLMYKFGVGVQMKDTFEIKQIDEDFFEES